MRDQDQKHNRVLIHAALDPHVRDFLVKRAEKDQRTFSSTVNLALKRWVEIERRKEARG